MIVSRLLSEPDRLPQDADDPSFHTGSELFTRLKARWRVMLRAVLPKALSTRLALGRPGPFQRLDFWTAHHPLLFKLRLYSVTEPKINMWQGFTWETLRYWQDLMSGETTDLTIADARRWYDDSTSDDAERRAYALDEVGVAHAEPFAD